MVKITDGNRTIEVTKGMFDNLYSTMGYKLVDGNNKSEFKSVKKEENLEKETKIEEEEAKEVPKKEFPKASK